MSKKQYMDALAGLSDDDSEGGSSSSGSGAEDAAGGPAAKRAKQQAIDLERLRAHGYKEGPSVMFVPDKNGDDEQNWAWGSGTEHRQGQADGETFEERQANREAVNSKAEESAVYARRAVEQAEQLRAAKREEAQRLKADKKLSWNQKEKRKRDEGKATRGKNYVEEEKRRGREFGIVSGFD